MLKRLQKSPAPHRFGCGNGAKAGDALMQILAKFYFFDLRENLRRILFDYGQKCSCVANAAFKPG